MPEIFRSPIDDSRLCDPGNCDNPPRYFFAKEFSGQACDACFERYIRQEGDLIHTMATNQSFDQAKEGSA